MNIRILLNSVSSGAFCSTFCPSSVTTENFPAAILTHPGGAAPSAYESNVSFQGSCGATRALAAPVRLPTVALIDPACKPGSLDTVNAPSSTVPFKPSSDHVAFSTRRNRPLSSKSLACSFRVWPGFNTISVGSTCTHAGAPSPFSTGSSTAKPRNVVSFLGPTAYTASLETKKTLPCETAAPPRICSGVPSELQQLYLLIGISTSLSTSHLSACGLRMKNFPLSVPT